MAQIRAVNVFIASAIWPRSRNEKCQCVCEEKKVQVVTLVISWHTYKIGGYTMILLVWIMHLNPFKALLRGMFPELNCTSLQHKF